MRVSTIGVRLLGSRGLLIAIAYNTSHHRFLARSKVAMPPALKSLISPPSLSASTHSATPSVSCVPSLYGGDEESVGQESDDELEGIRVKDHATFKSDLEGAEASFKVPPGDPDFQVPVTDPNTHEQVSLQMRWSWENNRARMAEVFGRETWGEECALPQDPDTMRSISQRLFRTRSGDNKEPVRSEVWLEGRYLIPASDGGEDEDRTREQDGGVQPQGTAVGSWFHNDVQLGAPVWLTLDPDSDGWTAILPPESVLCHRPGTIDPNDGLASFDLNDGLYKISQSRFAPEDCARNGIRLSLILARLDPDDEEWPLLFDVHVEALLSCEGGKSEWCPIGILPGAGQIGLPHSLKPRTESVADSGPPTLGSASAGL